MSCLGLLRLTLWLFWSGLNMCRLMSPTYIHVRRLWNIEKIYDLSIFEKIQISVNWINHASIALQSVFPLWANQYSTTFLMSFTPYPPQTQTLNLQKIWILFDIKHFFYSLNVIRICYDNQTCSSIGFWEGCLVCLVPFNDLILYKQNINSPIFCAICTTKYIGKLCNFVFLPLSI